MLSNPTLLSVRNCVRNLEHCFKRFGVEEPKSSAQYIIAAGLEKKTLHNADLTTILDKKTWMKIKKMAKQRLEHKPVQYIIGNWDFRNITLDMKAPVLIPRPETEELVGHILSDVQENKDCSFLEIGCGTGAISLSLLEENQTLRGTAIDISQDACDLTVRNAKKYDLDGRLEVIHTSVQDYGKANGNKKFDFIVSNPPYISTADMNKLHKQVKDFEDETALHGGNDGLDLIKVILRLAPDLLKRGQFKGQGSVWLEVDSSHPTQIAQYVRNNVPQLFYNKTIVDFNKKPRFCMLHLNAG